MHVVVWAVFLYYLYAYRLVRFRIKAQLDQAKNETLWDGFEKWLASRHFRADLETAIGRTLENVGMSYSSQTEISGDKNKTNRTITTHALFSLSNDFTKQILSSTLFAESEKGAEWIKHTYNVSDEDVREFSGRRGYALTTNRLIWLEHQLPFFGAWILLVAGLILYGVWWFLPDSAIGTVCAAE